MSGDHQQQRRIHFGSLDRRAQEITGSSADPRQTTSSTRPAKTTTISFDNSTQDNQLSQAQLQLLEELDRKNKAKSIAVPTDDSQVRHILRQLKEPITLFGEGPYERRERLRMIFATREDLPPKLLRSLTQGKPLDGEGAEEEDEENEEFFTQGSEALLESRMFLVRYSLARARVRLEQQQREQDELSPIEARSERKSFYLKMKKSGLCASQFASERPLSSCAFAPDSSHLVTGCFGGVLKLWGIPTCNQLRSFEGHKERVGGVSWSPLAETSDDSTSSLSFASGAANGTVFLWNINQSEPLVQLGGHALRVASVDFHPSGRFLGTAGFDMCWKLWDVETGEELLVQEGHSKEVYALKFQSDGSLAASGGLDSLGRVWDLRTGRSIMLLQGHIDSISSIDWSPNGFEIATASADHTIRIHDLRQLKSSIHIIPAHTNLVSSVKYFHRYADRKKRDKDAMDTDFNSNMNSMPQHFHPECLISSGFDNTVKIWGHGDFKCLNTLSGHENKVMSMDVTKNGNYVASCSYDRTFKLWATNEEEVI